MNRLRPHAWILMVIADAGLLAWGAMAALAPARLLGPGGVPIITAEYQNYTGSSIATLVAASPKAAAFITVVFRVYGSYVVAFGLLAIFVAATAFRRGERWAWWALLITNTLAWGAAMRFDWVMQAIGPFELTEYLGLAVIYGALALTVQRRPARMPMPSL
jgi:hypothetical protein